MTTFSTIALFLAVTLTISLYFAFLPMIVNYVGSHLTNIQKRNLLLALKIPAFFFLAYALWFYTQHS